MKILKLSAIAACLLMISGTAQAILINFSGLANGSLGESAWNTLMFKSDGTHTTSSSDAFLDITATNGASSYAYMDSGNGGLGACGALRDASKADTAFPGSRSNLCAPGSDDNISLGSSGTGETVRFVFDDNVIIDSIWLNNNHDGDRSLLNDFVLIGGASTQLTNGGSGIDSFLNLGLALSAGSSFDVGYDSSRNCGNDCELYISKIAFSINRLPPSGVPEPTTLALLSLGLIGMGAVRRRQK